MTRRPIRHTVICPKSKDFVPVGYCKRNCREFIAEFHDPDEVVCGY